MYSVSFVGLLSLLLCFQQARGDTTINKVTTKGQYAGHRLEAINSFIHRRSAAANYRDASIAVDSADNLDGKELLQRQTSDSAEAGVVEAPDTASCDANFDFSSLDATSLEVYSDWLTEVLNNVPPNAVEMHVARIDALAGWLLNARRCDRNDCFFLTVARLLRTTPQDISKRTGIAIPPPGGSASVPLTSAVRALAKLGLQFNAWMSTPDAGGPIRQNHRLERFRGIPEQRAFVRGAPRIVGVVYFRPDGSGHCVIGRNPGRPYSRYTDYQLNPNGVDVTEDVRRSRIHAIFYVDMEASGGYLFDSYQASIQDAEEEEEKAHPETSGPGDGIAAANEVTASGIDLDDIPADALSRIRLNTLSENECLSLIASMALIFTTKHTGNGPRSLLSETPSISGNHALSKRSQCDQLRSYIAPRKKGAPLISIANPRPAPKQPCARIKDLEFGITLADDHGAGTYDQIGAIIEGPAGKAEFDIATDPPAGFSTRVPVDMKSSFGSDTIGINDINLVRLTAKGPWVSTLTNDEWKVKSVTLHAKCTEPGFEVSDDTFIKLNAWYQHPDASWVPFTGHSKENVDQLHIKPTDWTIAPACTLIKDLNYWFEIGDDWFGGTDNTLSFKLGDGKPVPLGSNLDRGFSKSESINLKDVFGLEQVDIRDIKALEFIDPIGSTGKRDKWLLHGINFTATCAQGGEKMKLKKFEDLNQWLAEDDDTGDTVFTGNIVPSDWGKAV